MSGEQADLGRPIRVVVFCGGPTLDRAVVRFVTQLQSHPEIEVVGGLCESGGHTVSAVIRDRVQRRGALGLVLVLVEAVRGVTRFVLHPRAEVALRRWRTRLAGQLHVVPDMHAPAALEQVRKLAPDLGLIYGGPILRPPLFELPRLGTLGIHHGKMPEYRGKKTTFWAMHNGDETAGVTIQKVNAGLDTGQILRRGEVRIAQKSLAAVTRELEELGFALYEEAILDVKRGCSPPVHEESRKGKLYRDPTAGDLVRFRWRQLRRRWHGAGG